MKREIMIMAGIALMAVSCAKTEFLDIPESKVITFDNAYVARLTKADLTSTSLSSFNVFGVTNQGERVFNDVEVYRNEDEGTWEYANPRYWKGGSSYSFAAYAPMEASSAISNIGMNSQGRISFDYNSDEYNQHDLVLAEKSYDSQHSVDLDFRHLLSIVYFVIRSQEGSDITFNINSMKVRGINTVAHYNGSRFENYQEPGTYTLLSEAGSCVKNEDLTSNAIYVLPQALENGKAQLVLSLNAMDSFGNRLTYNDELVIDLPEIDWRSNNTYVISTDMGVNDVNPNIQLSKIQFEVSVEDWKDGGESNM